MNTVQDHLDKARRNRDFLNSLTVTDTNADWAIVVLFYRALHLVRAYIHYSGNSHGTNHSITINEVNNLFPQHLSMSYQRLYSRSRLYRYDDLEAAAMDYAQLESNDFQPLLTHVKGTLHGAV